MEEWHIMIYNTKEHKKILKSDSEMIWLHVAKMQVANITGGGPNVGSGMF